MVEIKPFKGTRPYNEDAKNLNLNYATSGI